ncbi:NlpC/P60 family protein [Tsuneonella sp. HG249]
MTGADLAHAAARLVGAPFRLHGRDPVTGLDCVGVVAAAFAECGRPIAAPRGYGLRNRSIEPWLSLADESGLSEVCGRAKAGDVVLVRPGAGQHHLLVQLAGGRFVHAHAGLRRVVAQPAPLAWPEARRWRLAQED